MKTMLEKKIEVDKYCSFYAEFEKQCLRVAEKMKAYDSDYACVEKFYIDTTTNKVCGEGEDSYGCGGCEVEYYYVEFDPILLTYTDEELDEHVNNLLEEKRKEEEEKLKKEKEKERKEIQREIDYLTQKLNNLI